MPRRLVALAIATAAALAATYTTAAAAQPAPVATVAAVAPADSAATSDESARRAATTALAIDADEPVSLWLTPYERPGRAARVACVTPCRLALPYGVYEFVGTQRNRVHPRGSFALRTQEWWIRLRTLENPRPGVALVVVGAAFAAVSVPIWLFGRSSCEFTYPCAPGVAVEVFGGVTGIAGVAMLTSGIVLLALASRGVFRWQRSTASRELAPAPGAH